MQKRKLILKNFQSPGDLVMLTAAVRDIHCCQPGRFITDVRTPCPDLWEHNPHITPIDDSDPEAEWIKCEYPLIHQSNQRPFHFIHGFQKFLAKKLDAHIEPRAFHGDIYLHPTEKRLPNEWLPLIGNGPYWIIVAGGKHDFTIKWWSTDRWQAVVNHFKGRLTFVQTGEEGHHHPPLEGVIDMRGKTSTREFIRLTYFAEGVVCPVTFVMHLAAAIPPREGKRLRPCVVVAGGREPPHWEAYPGHQFIHTIGMLPCCESGGCWRSRTVPLDGGNGKNRPGSLCVDVVDDLPRCMHMITPQRVVDAIEGYMTYDLGRSDHPVSPCHDPSKEAR